MPTEQQSKCHSCLAQGHLDLGQKCKTTGCICILDLSYSNCNAIWICTSALNLDITILYDTTTSTDLTQAQTLQKKETNKEKVNTSLLHIIILYLVH